MSPLAVGRALTVSFSRWTGRERGRSRLIACQCLLGAVGLLIVACAPSAGDQARPTPADDQSPPATPETVSPSTTAIPKIRDHDELDVGLLASELSAGAVGDKEWIAIFADLRARSWLASRYPGAYDLEDIYVEEWAVDHADRLEQESVDLGVYLDEPLPLLLSISQTRELGELVELEVVLESGTATVRRDDNDGALETLSGGRDRGLFTLGRHPSTARWRIHSVVELSVVEAAEAGETP